MSPDDHYQDILRVISAMSGHASRINVIMPCLYESRQHKKNGKESLDCAMALRQLENLHVKNILTVDVHDKRMDNVLPYGAFTSYPPRKLLLKEFINDYPNMEDIIVIAPDDGADSRANYVADKLGNVGFGTFRKRRDLNNVIDGRNKILQHEYFGNEIEGKNAIIVDDMISSGASMLKTMRYLKEKGAKKIYIMVSFALFEKGIKEFCKAYDEGLFDKVYATNAAYIDPKLLETEWFKLVDLSNILAEMISDLHDGRSLGRYLEK